VQDTGDSAMPNCPNPIVIKREPVRIAPFLARVCCDMPLNCPCHICRARMYGLIVASSHPLQMHTRIAVVRSQCRRWSHPLIRLHSSRRKVHGLPSCGATPPRLSLPSLMRRSISTRSSTTQRNRRGHSSCVGTALRAADRPATVAWPMPIAP
jgi:hypothetical protein